MQAVHLMQPVSQLLVTVRLELLTAGQQPALLLLGSLVLHILLLKHSLNIVNFEQKVDSILEIINYIWT